MLQIYEEINVDNNTYIVDGNKELTLEQVGSGYWMLGFDRDGTCFEMYKTERSSGAVIDILRDADLEVYEHGDCTYYWTENIHDSSILYVH